MAEELLETVQRLHSRLRENPEPRKLLKTFRRLQELPVTVEILAETGVGKTVNSFRKHDAVGDAAKSLVAKWKKLLPQTADRSNSHTKEASRSYGHSRSDGHRLPREPSPEVERSYVAEERGYHTNYSPSPPQHDQYSPPQRGRYHSDEYESPEPEPELEPEPEPSPPPASPPPPRKEVRHVKPNKDAGRNHHHSDRGRDKDEERRQRHAQTSADRVGGIKRERQESPVHKPAKHSNKSSSQDSRRDERKKGGDDGLKLVLKNEPSEEEEEPPFEMPTMSFESFLTYDAPAPVKKKKKQSQPPPSSSSSSSHSRPSQSSSSSSSTHRNRTSPPAAATSSSSSSKASVASNVNGVQSSKRSHSSSSSSAAPAKRNRDDELIPALPEMSLAALVSNYRPLPSIDVSLSLQRRKGPAHNDEDSTGFTGKRLNSKMVVYSGKMTHLPRMMSLEEQCIRVLQNNIDSISDVGGVPFLIMEPVLERCTPEQLYRIEQCNQRFTEETDELWMRHCKRDFKRETPQEYESWREMYLRLHEAREERLKLLTSHISSAHANKPKGRQVKMAFVDSAAKPPRDVRRRQEKFGTTSGSSASSIAAAAPIKMRPASDVPGESSRHLSPQESSSRSSTSGSAGGAAGGGGSGGHAAREKPHVKKVAPMMAKTIKAFKNRFSRR